VLCNREIKFDIFAEEARKRGADFIATGHYCRNETINLNKNSVHRLLAGKDENKDQSYFLCQVSQEQLSGALFPAGDITKPEVRKIADDLKLATAHRKDSQGICFVGKVHLPTFLQQKLKAKKGKIIEVMDAGESRSWHSGFPDEDISEDELKEMTSPHILDRYPGRIVGEHNGAHFFTVGQRKGINVGGYKEPLFVIGTDVEKNILYTGEGQSHPGLYRKGLFIRKDEIHWIRPDLAMSEGENREYMVRIRYRQPLQKAKLIRRNDGMYVVFSKLQRGVAPGQFAAWYDGDEVIGSGVIDR